MAELTVQSRGGGVYLPALGLWLDPHEAVRGPERVFVSHAHSDHMARHREVILTAPTARLMQARLGGGRVQQVVGYGETREFEHEGRSWRITLLPAGHILGSAMALIEADGASLLFTGDCKLRRGLLAEPCEPRRADTLILESTFGRPVYRFDPAVEVMKQVVAFCRTTMESGAMPVLFAYSLGKSQELLRGLVDQGWPVLLHEETLRLTEIHEAFGCVFPRYSVWNGLAVAGSVLICPPGTRAVRGLRSAGEVRTAAATGWAVDKGCCYRMGCDAAFPLSDHADYGELLELVERVQPRRVFTVHGFARDFAWSLRDRGWQAQALGVEEQMTLLLGAS